ncbi:hypothetical protein DFJ63DRAFT_310317 [Scheffersomyces coipomensis]|uniref:uncharacterized protein n=1 Tax=Scheffersomyces coipomensis TaxID=1788519 RepID=UPI00315DBC60
MVPQYDDNYIYKFFTFCYINFPIELKITILKHLSLARILLFKSLIKDDETKNLQIRSITTEKLYDVICKHCEKCFQSNSFSDIIHLIKGTDNIIPIVLRSDESAHYKLGEQNCFSFSHLDEYYGIENNTEFELDFYNLYYSKCMNLTDFPYPNRVSTISILKIIGTETLMELDLSPFSQLKTLRLISKNNMLKLVLSPNVFESVNELAIDNNFDSDYYTKFKNLKIFEIFIQKGRNFYIKSIPRGVITLTIITQYLTMTKETWGGEVLLDSWKDWPRNLRHLSVNDMYNSNGIFKDVISKLPPHLSTLTVHGYPINSILSQIPDSISHLNVNFKVPTCNVEKIDFDFPSSLQSLTLNGLVLKAIDKIYKVPRGVTSFNLSNCEFSMSLDNFNFDNCKSCLEWLQFDNCLDSFSLVNADFNDFTKLNKIIFTKCGIYSLSNFRPPSCLSSLRIFNNPITSIDESCQLFNKERDYPLLRTIWINGCQISLISSNIEFPVNLNELVIVDNTTKVFYFNSSIARHVSLKTIHLSKLSSIEFCDDIDETCMKSNFSSMSLNVTNDFLPSHPDSLKVFYDKLELYVRKTLYTRECVPENGHISYNFRSNRSD